MFVTRWKNYEDTMFGLFQNCKILIKKFNYYYIFAGKEIIAGLFKCTYIILW